MGKRGDAAREAVKNKIIETFNATGDFVAFQDKKIYVQAKDGANGEVIQFAITMTMPKTPIEVGQITNAIDGVASPVVMSTELSNEDKAQVEMLKNKLKDLGVYQE